MFICALGFLLLIIFPSISYCISCIWIIFIGFKDMFLEKQFLKGKLSVEKEKFLKTIIENI